LKKLLAGLLLVLVALWVYLAFVGVEPKDRRPGTLLGGEPASMPADWSFLNDASATEVHLETYPWYGVPFSVTTVVAADAQGAYVPSIYNEVLEFPGSKFWNKVVQANPEIRLRAAGKLYELAIYPISERAEFDRAFAALAKKYPFWAQKRAQNNSEHEFVLLRLAARS